MGFGLAATLLALAAAGGAAVFFPARWETFFHRTEAQARFVARHRTLTCLGLALLVMLVRGALLPLWPIPKPVVYDEFSYTLQADTFAHGRLTNPTHKLWPFFESAYVLQHPTYASKYPPAQSLAMAAGQALFGDPWFGVWLSCGAMAAALVWAMQGWLPPGWALMGGLLALPLEICSYWMNSYWGGAVSAIGGALILGGYGRVVKRRQPRYALAIGIGLAILANARPYEGLVFSVPVAIAFLLSRPRWSAAAFIAAVLIPAFAWTAYYNRAVTGNALQSPYTEYTRQYSRIPLFTFQPLQPAKENRTPVTYDLHRNWEPEQWARMRTWQLIPTRLKGWTRLAGTVLGSELMGLPVVLFLGVLWRDRRIRLPLICLLAVLAGSLIEIRFYPHYAGPVTVALLIVAVQVLRRLRQWNPWGQPVGRFLSRTIPILVFGAAVTAQALVIVRQEAPDLQAPIARRDELTNQLDDQDARHVILVRYTSARSPHEEWVYNTADIDAQDVIWAHDLGPAENAPLLEYYKDRKIWLLQPDINPFLLKPYDEPRP